MSHRHRPSSQERVCLAQLGNEDHPVTRRHGWAEPSGRPGRCLLLQPSLPAPFNGPHYHGKHWLFCFENNDSHLHFSYSFKNSQLCSGKPKDPLGSAFSLVLSLVMLQITFSWSKLKEGSQIQRKNENLVVRGPKILS